MTERSKTNPIPVVHTAAAYIRVSTDDQIELSPASQLVEIRKWADSHGFWVPDEYVFTDEGISGRKVTGRDEFRRMIGVAKSKPKPFDAILLWKFSRFARNRDDAVMYKSILRKQLGIDVISISEPMAEGKMGIITEALIEAMDEYYSINLAEEVKRGMEEKHRRGELQSVPSYGYSVKDGVLIPKPPEDEYLPTLSGRRRTIYHLELDERIRTAYAPGQPVRKPHNRIHPPEPCLYRKAALESRPAHGS